jgi:hypothetical protein
VKEAYYRFVRISNKEPEGSSPTLCHVIPKSVIFHRLGGRKLPVKIFLGRQSAPLSIHSNRFGKQ